MWYSNPSFWILLAGMVLISFVITGLMRNLARRLQILDLPTERSSHSIPTPRGGGIAIVVTWFTGISVLFQMGLIEKPLYIALLPGALLAIVGLLDDLINIHPLIRLFIQLITAISALVVLNWDIVGSPGGFFQLDMLFYFMIAVPGIVWFINLFNFLDGIDAYASNEAIFLAIATYFFTGEPILLALAAAVAGFLYWNWPKAKIFMGDVGSTQLGFIIIVLAVHFHTNDSFELVYWIMLSSVFWFDATLTLIKRILNRENPSQAHRKHAYQRWVQAGNSHLTVNMHVLIINLIVFLLTLVAYYFTRMLLPCLLVNVIILSLIYTRIGKAIPFSQKSSG